jgi:ubiquinone/menaquinone biosynthesis C-methylase UbiE
MTEFDRYQDGYEKGINDAIRFSGKPQDFFTQVKADYLSDLFAAHFGEEMTAEVLDIGCGSGAIHPLLLERRPHLRLTGVDVASAFIDIARTNHPQVHYDVFDGSHLPYPNGRFAAAFAICVLHHVPPAEWPTFLAEMRRVVRPGGIVCVVEHNPYNPLTAWIVRTCEFDRNAILLRSSKLTRLMAEAGLADVKRRYIEFSPFGGAVFKRIDRVLGWLPLGAQYIASAVVPRQS